MALNLRRAGTPGTFEIWFYVVVDPDARTALWVRHTSLVPAAPSQEAEEGHAITWAAAWGGSGGASGLHVDAAPIALKSVAPARELRDRGARVESPGAVFEPSRASGAVERGGRAIAWDLAFAPATEAVRRAPRAFEALPLPVHVEHAHARTPVTGWFAVDGARTSLGPRARLVQAHIWGTRQADEIFWVWAPALEGLDDGGLELVGARPRATALVPRLASLVLEAGDLAVDGAALAPTLRTRITRAELGLLEARASAGPLRAIVRAFAPPESFVGWVYRGPNGRCVYVAQSDVARCSVEVYRRRGPRLAFERELRAPQAALEIHLPEPLRGVDYLAWDREGPAIPPRRAPARPAAAETVPLPPIERVFALGLTYADHVRETGSRAPDEPVVFEKAFVSLSREGELVAIPTSDAMLEALDALEPGLAGEARRRFGALPPLMDYEVEVGLVLLEPASARDLDDPRFAPRVAWFLANDLTARSCQILGEGMAAIYAYCAVAKSFPGFLPVSARALASRGIDSAPELELVCAVNGDVRQRGSTKDLVYTPRRMLQAAARFAGADLPAGTALITGTPAGVGLRVPRWKKALGDRLLDRFGKLAAAIASHARGDRLLRAGDAVVCSAGPLGERRVVLTV